MLDFSTADRSERVFGKVALSALGLAALVIVGWPLAGLLVGEDARGNLAYGLTIGAILVDAALLSCLGSIATVQRAVRAFWIVLIVVALALSIYLTNINDPDAYKAADTVLLTVMGILAFPLSVVGFVLVYLYSSLFLATRPTTAVDLVAFWGILAAAGYMQWFLLIPMLLRKMQRPRQTRAGPKPSN